MILTMWLSIDTSLDHFVIAVHGETKPTVGICLPNSDERTRVAYMFLDGFFKEHSIDTKSITKISVGIGPGPYIAVRTGVSLANGFAAGLGVKILPLCSLLLMQPNPVATPTLYRRPARLNEELWMVLRNSSSSIQSLSANDTWREFDYTTTATDISGIDFIDEIAVEYNVTQLRILDPACAVENLVKTTILTAEHIDMQPEILPAYLRPAR